MQKELKSAREVVDALGRPSEVARMVGVSTEAVCNWYRRGHIPPARYLDLLPHMPKGIRIAESVFRPRKPDGAS